MHRQNRLQPSPSLPLSPSPPLPIPLSPCQLAGCLSDQGRIYVQRLWVYVHEDGDGAFVEDDVRRGDEGEGGGYDQIPFTDASGNDAEVQSRRAAGDSDGMACPDVGSEALLELVNARAEADDGRPTLRDGWIIADILGHIPSNNGVNGACIQDDINLPNASRAVDFHASQAVS